jgi:hypothetical protein
MKNDVIRLRISESEKELIRQQAESLGMGISAYMRGTILRLITQPTPGQGKRA